MYFIMYEGHKKLDLYWFSDHFLEEFQKEKQSFDHYDFWTILTEM